jgi:hypothetical protein
VRMYRMMTMITQAVPPVGYVLKQWGLVRIDAWLLEIVAMFTVGHV